MRANVNCRAVACRSLTVYLNGKRLSDCFEGDEEQGYVWVAYRDVAGKKKRIEQAENGALIWSDLQVIRLTGQVRFEIDPPEGMSVEDVRRKCEERFVPITPATKLGEDVQWPEK